MKASKLLTTSFIVAAMIGFNVLPSLAVPEIPPLEITVTANTQFARTWNWELEKTANKVDFGTLQPGETATVNYEITATPTAVDHSHLVFGTITITNPVAWADAEIESIEDNLNVAGNVVVNCPSVTFPHKLLGSQTLNCNYSSNSVGTDSKNIVTVAVTGESLILGGSSEVAVVWTEPAEENDECIYLSDSHAKGPQNEMLCVNGNKKVLSYDLTYSKDATADVSLGCNANQHINTADFYTVDQKVLGTDSWTVNGNVNCVTNGGGGGGGGGGGFIFPPAVVPPTPPVVPVVPQEPQVLGEQIFAETPTPQVLGEQVVAPTVQTPTFPKTGTGPAITTNNMPQMYLAFVLIGLFLVSLFQKKAKSIL